MRISRALLVTVVALVVFRSEAMPQTQSARRYVEIPERNTTTCKFELLDREEIQRELNLTTNQIAAIAEVYNASFESIPGFKEKRATYKKLSEDEQRQRKSEQFEEETALVSKWEESRLKEVLNDGQAARLDSLMLQMIGPRAILTVEGAAGTLGITPDQKVKMLEIVKQHREEAAPFYARFGHNALQRSRRSQTEEEARQEQDALVVVITEIGKAGDEQMLAQLTKEQREQWDIMEGRLVSISWPETAVFYAPFSDGTKGSSNGAAATVAAPGK